jgi:hypothetical protein
MFVTVDSRPEASPQCISETPIRENLDETDASSQIIETLEPFAEVEPESEVEPRSEVEPESEEQLADHSSLIGIVVAVVSIVVLAVAGAFALVAYRKRKAYKVRCFFQRNLISVK